jgi:hypothetical protein
VTLTATRSKSWHESGQLIFIPVVVTATDVCDSAPVIECRAWSVDSDGTRQDYEVVWVNGQLAVVRPPHLHSRGSTTYTLECSATDASGNRGSSTITTSNGDQNGNGDFNWNYQH